MVMMVVLRAVRAERDIERRNKNKDRGDWRERRKGGIGGGGGGVPVGAGLWAGVGCVTPTVQSH